MRKFLPCPIKAVTSGPKHHFFGYYDKCPWDATGRYLLAMEVDLQDRLPGPEDVALIGVVELSDNNTFRPVAETRAWNFQQGAMAQWVPGAADRLIIYNDRERECCVSVLLDLKSGQRRRLPLPVYAISLDGRYALSVNFARVRYSYAGVCDPWDHEPIPKDDGIYRMDLTTGKYDLILTYAQVASFHYSPAMEGGKHWIEHLMVNPDSTRFLFLHRFPLPDGGFCTRLLTANLDGSDFCLLAEGMVSHLCWRNSKQILAWGRRPSLVTRARHRGLFASPAFRWALNWARRQERGWIRQHVIGDSFLLFTDRTQHVEAVGVGVLTEDGHCTYSPDGRWILMDTYPDRNAQRWLILYDPVRGRRIDVGRFDSPVLEGPTRCDLHPRWNNDGTQICIDSMHEGSRQVYVVEVAGVVQEGRAEE